MRPDGDDLRAFKHVNFWLQVSSLRDHHGESTEVWECLRLSWCKDVMSVDCMTGMMIMLIANNEWWKSCDVTPVDCILDSCGGWDLCHTCTGLIVPSFHDCHGEPTKVSDACILNGWDCILGGWNGSDP